MTALLLWPEHVKQRQIWSYAPYKQISMSKKRAIKSTLAQSNEVLLVIDYTETREDTIK